MGHPLSVNVGNFNNEILSAKRPAVVDFWAPWCGPCRALAPVLEEVATETANKAIVAKVNVDENPELAAKYGVRGIPTLIFFKDGEIKSTLVGVQSKAEILKTLENIT
jgi:thioredoxin 1